MSEEEVTSGFTGDGFEGMPNFYGDNKLTAEISGWTDAALIYKYNEYLEWVNRDDIMPRAQGLARRIMAHLTFEYVYRSELDPAETNELRKMEDEFCGE